MPDERDRVLPSTPTTVADATTELFDRRSGWTLYVPDGTTDLGPSTPAMWVYDQFAGDEAPPTEAGSWTPALGMPTLRAVMDGLRSSRPRPNPDEVIDAWNRAWRGSQPR